MSASEAVLFIDYIIYNLAVAVFVLNFRNTSIGKKKKSSFVYNKRIENCYSHSSVNNWMFTKA